MRIAVHAKVLSEVEPTGIGVYTHNILKALARIDGENEYVLFSNEPIRQKVDAPNFHEKILHFPRFWSYLRLPWEFVGKRYDLLFVPKEQIPIFLRPPTVLVVFDLMNLLFPEHMSLGGKVHFSIAMRHAIPAADAVIAISEHTKRLVLEHCNIVPDRLTVTHLGYDPQRFHVSQHAEAVAAVRARYGLEGPYFVNPSSVIWHRKNPLRLLRAFARLKADGMHADLRLVFTGKRGRGFDEVLELRRSLGLERDVLFTGYVPDEDLPLLFTGALGLVFPSLDEGFGLPLIEAMACGCPVISSKISAMREVVADAGILVDPLDVEELERAMRALVEDAALRQELKGRGLVRARRFSWDDAARKTLQVFQRLHAESSRK